MSVSEIECLCRDKKVLPHWVWLDARYEPQRVRRIAALKGWKTLMGDKQNSKGFRHNGAIFRIYDEGRHHDPLIGTQDQGRGEPVLEVLFSRQAALNRLHLLCLEKYQPVRKEGEDKDPEPRFKWSAAQDMPDFYWPQVEAHYRKKVVNKDGSESQVWHGLREDHCGDCEAMHIVVASIAGLTGAESMVPVEVATPNASLSIP